MNCYGYITTMFKQLISDYRQFQSIPIAYKLIMLGFALFLIWFFVWGADLEMRGLRHLASLVGSKFHAPMYVKVPLVVACVGSWLYYFSNFRLESVLKKIVIPAFLTFSVLIFVMSY